MEKKPHFMKNIRKRNILGAVFRECKTKGNGITLILLILCILIEISPEAKDIQVLGISGTYSEDFTTTTYRDPITNTSGWGDGEIILPYKNIELLGIYEEPDPYNPSYYDWFPISIFVDGDLAYITQGSGLEIFNVSDLRDIKRISVCDLGESFNPKDITVVGDYAYVLCYTGLVIFDVSNPFHPVSISSFTFPVAGYGLDLEVLGDYVFIVQQSTRSFYILNISNLYDPQSISTITISEDSEMNGDLVIEGNYAYVSGGWPGFYIINITNLKHPEKIHEFIKGSKEVVIKGDYAYMLTGGVTSFEIYNISDPSLPYQISSMSASGVTVTSSSTIDIWGNYVFLAHDLGLRVIDISNPLNPTTVYDFRSTFEWGDFHNIVISGDHMFVLDSVRLLVYEISDFTPPELVGSYNDPDTTLDVLVDGTYVYLSDIDGVKIIDNSNPLNPTLLGAVSTPNMALSIDIDGDYVYTANFLSGMQIINISDPRHPEIIGSYNIPDDTENLVVVGNTIFLADHNNGLHIANITNPSNPSFLSTFDTTGSVWDVYIVGDNAFVADYDAGLLIVDISDPKNPVLRSTYDTPGNAVGLVVDGEYAFIADTSGMQIVNITDVDNPSFAGEFYALGGAVDIDISGNQAYLAANEYGIQIVNITNPRHPISIDVCNTYNATGVKREGEYVYVADYNGGLQVIEVAKHKYRQYEELSIAQSLPIITGPENSSLIRATLSSSDNTLMDTTLAYYLSADNGTTWEQVESGVEHNFISSGYVLRWRSILTTLNASLTPSIFSLSISYGSQINPPSLLTPLHGDVINNNMPKFEWESVSGALNYNIQIATDASFTPLSLLINQTVVSTSYTPSSPLIDDIIYWKVAAIDLEGIGVFSPVFMLTIDTITPTIAHPSDFAIFYGSSGYSITWSTFDEHPDSYSVLRNGSFYDSGFWDSSVTTVLLPTLEVGKHNFTCICTDLAGNPTFDDVWVTILPTAPDNTPPIVSHPPDTQFEEGSMGYKITWTGSDNQSPWWASVRRNGLLIYNKAWIGNDITISLNDLVFGLYTFNCTLYDEAGNSVSDLVVVNVTEAIPDITPPIIIPPSSLEYEEGTQGHFLNWITNDNHPYAYSVSVNSSQTIYAPWHGENITVSVDDLSLGDWNITLTVWDIAGNNASEWALVFVKTPLPDITPPFASIPAEIIVTENMAGTIIWEVQDDHPDRYKIVRNYSVIVQEGYWMAGIIQYQFSSLLLGTWVFNLTLWDIAGNARYSTAVVHVIPGYLFDNDPPEISSIPDMIIEFGTTGNEIEFHLFDNHPYKYCIVIGTILLQENFWETPNIVVVFSLDNFAIGQYSLNITAYDIFNNNASEIVSVTVTGDMVPPQISSPDDLVVYQGNLANLTWVAYDTEPSHYEIINLSNGDILESGYWNGEVIIFDVSKFSLGTHIIRCMVFDAAGNSALDDVTISVIKSQSIPGFQIHIILNLVLITYFLRRVNIVSKRRRVLE